MRLKRIEIYGFKSFGKKTVLHFNDPVTVVVGPNGSGKSNIADAVRWALGEQSAKSLRGAKMEDIIFSGGQDKKPLNMAQVALIFDNSEGKLPVAYQEVEVRRTLFRSGETKYELNQSTCRLKDIRNLFLDTGVGKEGYSIIGQGKIDEIVNAKEQDRRHLFEEATGIAKDRQQIEEATQKLKKTEENLVRVLDILGQYKEQIGFLYKEAEKAKHGMALSKDFEAHTIAYYQKEMQQWKQQVQDLDEKYRALEQQLLDETALFERLKEEQRLHAEKNHAFLEEYHQAKLQERQVEKQIETANREIQLAKQRLTFAQKEKERVALLQSEGEERLQALDDQQKTLHEKMAVEDQALAALKHAFHEASRIKDEGVQALTALRESVQEKEQEKQRLLDVLQEQAFAKRQDAAQKEQLHLMQNDLRERLKEQKQQLDTFDQAVTQWTATVDDEEKQLKAKKEEQEQLTHSIKARQESFRTREEQYRGVLRQKNRIEEQLKSIRFAEENHESYYRPNQRLLQAAKKDTRLRAQMIGPLGDLITVDKDVRVAIEMAMGAALQNIVTEKKTDAKALIEWLRNEKVGRVTFLPLDNLSFSPYKGVFPSRAEGAWGPALDFVHADMELQPLLESLLGRTCVIKDMQAGVSLRDNPKYRGLKLVTLEGDILHAGGSMVGGYAKNTAGILTRETEKEALELQLATLKEQESALEAEEKSERQKRAEEEENLQKIQSSFDQLRQKAQESASALSRALAQQDVYAQQTKRLEEEYESNAKRLLEAVDEVDIESHKETLKHIEVALTTEKEQLSAQEEKRLTLEMDVAQARMQVDTKERYLVLLKNQQSDLDERLSKEQLQSQKNKEDLSYYETQEVDEAQALTRWETSEEDNIQRLAQLKDDVAAMDAKGKAMQEEEQQRQEAVSRAEKATLILDQEVKTVAVKKESAEERYLNLFEMIADELGWEEDQVAEAMEKPQELTTTKKKLKEIKDALRRLGSFSYESIEAYREMKEKQGFLQVQSEDLKQSKEDLLKVIAKLEQSMRKDFKTGIREINEKFQEIFAILFQGGQAEVTLTGEDVLTAGVQIIAKPPGKQRQALTLLSGGEKALTAVALLFAIFETRPSPFCVLDEIDAALDDANIERYKSYLASFRGRIQFIIITHRKKTMELADFIYGVTMEKNTMSQIVPLAIHEKKA